MNPFRLQLSYRPRGERLPGLMPYLRCPGKRPLTPEERAELQPLEQELAELVEDELVGDGRKASDTAVRSRAGWCG